MLQGCAYTRLSYRTRAPRGTRAQFEVLLRNTSHNNTPEGSAPALRLLVTFLSKKSDIKRTLKTFFVKKVYKETLSGSSRLPLSIRPFGPPNRAPNGFTASCGPIGHTITAYSGPARATSLAKCSKFYLLLLLARQGHYSGLYIGLSVPESPVPCTVMGSAII